MRRGEKITLYELMGQTDEREDAAAGDRANAPQSVRLPLGAVYIGCAILLLIGCGIFALGYWRGSSAAESHLALLQADAERADAQLKKVAEPVHSVGLRSEFAAARVSEMPVVPAVDVLPDTLEPTAPAPPAYTLVPSNSGQQDPRVTGWNYYVVAHPSKRRADELVAFCQANGLDAWRVQTGSGLPKVIVLPGYMAGESNTPAILALRESIRTVGILWERQNPGRNQDFSTRFAEKYRGQQASVTP